MKVADLVEADEWSNQEVTQIAHRLHLYKKQLSACHRFEIMAKRVGYYRQEFDFFDTLKNVDANFIKNMLELFHTGRSKYPELFKFCDHMLKAKKDYEAVGGRYQRYGMGVTNEGTRNS